MTSYILLKVRHQVRYEEYVINYISGFQNYEDILKILLDTTYNFVKYINYFKSKSTFIIVICIYSTENSSKEKHI